MNNDDKAKQNINASSDITEEKQQEEPTQDKKIAELEEKIKELDNNWKRALADYQNLQKRVASDREDYIRYAVSGILLKFIEILDHLEEAQKHLNDKGVDLVVKIYKDILKSEGVEEMEREGKDFDPNFDECIEKKEARLPARQGEKNNLVIQVIKKGYLLRGVVLRAAKVVVEIKK